MAGVFKKFILCSAVLLMSICSQANAYIFGPQWKEDWVYVQPRVYSGPYAEGFGGPAFIDWRHFNAGGRFADPAAFNTERLEGGWVGGADFGYQYNQYIAIEGGWIALPGPEATVGVDVFSANTWAAYFAGKIIAPIFCSRFFLFAKFGGDFRRTYIRNDTSGSWVPGVQNLPIKAGYWAPMWALGIQYYFNWSWSASLQYMRLPGYFNKVSIDQEIKTPVPTADIITLAIAYKLQI